jgi:glutamate 5-kinase
MRNFSKAKRIVIKVGTNTLTGPKGIDVKLIAAIAKEITILVAIGKQVILVTSGAVGMGADAMGIKNKINDVKKRQAFAAIGQVTLMQAYHKAFNKCQQKVAQVLLTNDIMSQRAQYVNVKNTVESLLDIGVVPIINENDCVSIAEISKAFGDNDKLSALVASKIDAHLLVILTDVDGLYDKNPRKHTSARLIPVVYEITDVIKNMATVTTSPFAIGGMKSKINAIDIVSEVGCKTVLANGRVKKVIQKIVAGEEIGTLFLPKRRLLSNRKRWILNCYTDSDIGIDDGAQTALLAKKSLLLVGITNVSGHFKAGEVVKINHIAKGICNVSSTELAKLIAQKEKCASAPPRQVIVHANNLVSLF